jgi:hypothetical protein
VFDECRIGLARGRIGEVDLSGERRVTGQVIRPIAAGVVHQEHDSSAGVGGVGQPDEDGGLQGRIGASNVIESEQLSGPNTDRMSASTPPIRAVVQATGRRARRGAQLGIWDSTIGA